MEIDFKNLQGEYPLSHSHPTLTPHPEIEMAYGKKYIKKWRLFLKFHQFPW